MRSARTLHLGRSVRVLGRLAGVGALAACAAPGQPPEPPGPVAAQAQLSPVKLIAFQWSGGEGASAFSVARLVNGSPVVVADGIAASATGHDLEVFLPDQLEARYVVEACNAAGCVSSSTVQVAREALDAAIGYVKAPGPDVGDRFGFAVALSADGSVLVVGALEEDGSGAGVGPPVDEVLVDSGAVFAYTRSGAGSWSGPLYLKAPVPGISDEFGATVAVSADGSVIAVGAPGESGSGTGVNPPHDDLASNAGALYLY